MGIKAVRAKWELERDIEAYCDDVQNQILTARAAGDDARADVLRQRLISSSGIAVSSERDIAADEKPDIHSAGK
jgi:DNA-binding FrmR family transcriptional regulator